MSASVALFETKSVHSSGFTTTTSVRSPIIPKVVSNAKSMQRAGERERHLRRYEMDHAYTPANVLSHSAKRGASYEIYVNSDGILFIDRAEVIYIIHDDQPGMSDSQMSLKWNLGELERAEKPAQ